ncbi:hypothetical protein EI94DRAFT_1793898 [Lactarius quietus]|nr:hypothetical protein EI94DRAFT_1793898 [Lactarius quietus]
MSTRPTHQIRPPAKFGDSAEDVYQLSHRGKVAMDSTIPPTSSPASELLLSTAPMDCEETSSPPPPARTLLKRPGPLIIDDIDEDTDVAQIATDVLGVSKKL